MLITDEYAPGRSKAEYLSDVQALVQVGRIVAGDEKFVMWLIEQFMTAPMLHDPQEVADGDESN